ncbi:hypothetical protein BLNAU_617 [Blattamonas nauphoetae]|uniref:Uncharacterized protein n=1 Tax=Blattamonas nauphoetae TaxID=2049346 RepID=A0ABQ9YM31_9EUKA|nr:hypothetical protein BLNAU_617 [Blattamonas nauphoetae]
MEMTAIPSHLSLKFSLGITNSSDIVAEYSSAGQITFSKSMLELDKTNEPEQAPNVHGFASFSGLLFENRWEDFIRVNEAILAVVERVQRKTRLDGSELAFPPLIRADILSEVTSTLLKVVEKKTEEHTHKLVSTAIQSSLTLDIIPEKYESLFVLSVPLLQRSISFLLHVWPVFTSHVEREPTTVSSIVSLLRFVSLLQNWQLTLTGITSLVHLFHTLPFKGSPPLTSLPVSCLFSDVPNINPKRVWVFDLTHSLLDGKKAFLHPVVSLTRCSLPTPISFFCPSPLYCNGDRRT